MMKQIKFKLLAKLSFAGVFCCLFLIIMGCNNSNTPVQTGLTGLLVLRRRWLSHLNRKGMITCPDNPACNPVNPVKISALD